MGSVHYTSPEQARGGYSDEKSDIYSLGITMFEMLTGRVPFNGETTVAIAIKHIQEEMPSPKELISEIPASVDGIVLKCCQKSPDRRYQNLQEVIADLKQSLMNTDEDFVVQKNPDTKAGTRMISDADMAQIKKRTVYVENSEYQDRDEGMRLRTDTAPMYQSEEDIEDDDEYDYNPGMERFTTLLTILAGVIICIIIIILALKIFGDVGENGNQHQSPIVTIESEEPIEQVAYVKMPNVTGINIDDAKKSLEGLGLKVQESYEESDTVDEGVVIRTNIVAGTELSAGSKVELIVSAGVKGIEVPEVAGFSFEEANSRLVSVGFLVNKVEAYSDTV